MLFATSVDLSGLDLQDGRERLGHQNMGLLVGQDGHDAGEVAEHQKHGVGAGTVGPGNGLHFLELRDVLQEHSVVVVIWADHKHAGIDRIDLTIDGVRFTFEW